MKMGRYISIDANGKMTAHYDALINSLVEVHDFFVDMPTSVQKTEILAELNEIIDWAEELVNA